MQMRCHGAHKIPRKPQQISCGHTNCFHLGDASLAKRVEILREQGQILQPALGASGAGVVHQHINASNFCNQLGNRDAYLPRLCGVHRQDDNPCSTDVGRFAMLDFCSVELLAIATGHDNGRPLSEEAASDLRADVAGRAGDQCHLSGEATARGSAPILCGAGVCMILNACVAHGAVSIAAQAS